MAASVYERWIPHESSSLPYARFARDFTTLNSYYWGGASASYAVAGKLRHLTDADDFRAELGLIGARFTRPLGHATTVYVDQVKASQEWHRRAALVMLLSAFERYLGAVTTLAAASNPTLSTSPRLLDGLALRKHAVQLAEHDLVGIVKGSWSARAATYAKLFGACITLESSIGDLDRMRVARNEIAHQFGTQLQTGALNPHAALLVGARRTASAYGEVSVTEKSLLKWFGVVRSVASAIDKQLLRDHLGSYEIAALYLEWEPDPAKFEQACGAPSLWSKGSSRDRNAKRFLTFALGSSGVTVDYVKSMKSYLGGL